MRRSICRVSKVNSYRRVSTSRTTVNSPAVPAASACANTESNQSGCRPRSVLRGGPAASDIWFALEIDVSVVRGDDHLSLGAQRALGIKERAVEDLAEEELLTEVDDAAGSLPGDRSERVTVAL